MRDLFKDLSDLSVHSPVSYSNAQGLVEKLANALYSKRLGLDTIRLLPACYTEADGLYMMGGYDTGSGDESEYQEFFSLEHIGVFMRILCDAIDCGQALDETYLDYLYDELFWCFDEDEEVGDAITDMVKDMSKAITQAIREGDASSLLTSESIRSVLTDLNDSFFEDVFELPFLAEHMAFFLSPFWEGHAELPFTVRSYSSKELYWYKYHQSAFSKKEQEIIGHAIEVITRPFGVKTVERENYLYSVNDNKEIVTVSIIRADSSYATDDPRNGRGLSPFFFEAFRFADATIKERRLQAVRPKKEISA